jgi:hypothetical protein
VARASELAHYLFQADEDDDQYSPDIFIDDLSPEHLTATFNLLRGLSTSLGPHDYIWHKHREAEIPLADLADPTALVISGEGEQFHVRFEGLRINQTQIPVLGAFVVCSDGIGQISLHYYVNELQNGDVRWSADAVDALFELLRDIQRLAPEARIHYDLALSEDRRTAFASALAAK